jgi:dihydroflavonol-4-reductase
MDLASEGIVLVTGAGGFVGSAVARRLIAAGARVRVIVRASSPLENIDLANCDVVLGDLRDVHDVRAAMSGVEVVFHVAADYRIWAPDPEEIRRNNLTMTRCVMEAVLEAGVRRVVYTSSVATLRAFRDGRSSDETQPSRENTAVGAYKRSKIAAERLVEKMVAERGLPAVIVNPSTPIGPRDIKPTPTGRIVLEAASGRMAAFVDTGLNLVHVDDVAEGHLQALQRGKLGERYILGGQNVTLRAMLAEIARLVGRSPPRLRLPRIPLYPVAYVSEFVARFSGREPMATVDGLGMTKYYMYFSSAKAERELGFFARPYAEALRDAVAWFRAEDRLP